MRAEVYPKVFFTVNGDARGFRWTVADRNAVQARLTNIANGFPNATITDWSLPPDWNEGATRFDGSQTEVRTPKVVMVLDVPNATTHQDIAAVLTADGYIAWVQNALRNKVSPLVVDSWVFQVLSSLDNGETIIHLAGP